MKRTLTLLAALLLAPLAVLPGAETPRNSDIDPQGTVQPGAPPAQLYNLRDDLSQTTNHFRDQPDTAKRVAAPGGTAAETQTSGKAMIPRRIRHGPPRAVTG